MDGLGGSEAACGENLVINADVKAPACYVAGIAVFAHFIGKHNCIVRKRERNVHQVSRDLQQW